MDSENIIDDVNALLKLGVGDPYRLEHIKQAYILNKTIWKSDDKYLKQLRVRYLVKHKIDQPDIQPEINENLENDSENNDIIHCWKCGKKGPLGANFCMICGSSIFEVGEEPQTADVQIPSSHSKKQTKTSGLKIPILIGIPVLILIIIGGAYSQGLLDNTFERSSNDQISTEIEDEEIFYGEFDSKCGAGAVLDPETNECRVGSVKPAS
ncbi:MAG: zinc ribbon domain-containing protein [Thaumarchaeota archaeon]|nr:zinc ribbon domain-containing protein [Nitrososphaerota archaeon]